LTVGKGKNKVGEMENLRESDLSFKEKNCARCATGNDGKEGPPWWEEGRVEGKVQVGGGSKEVRESVEKEGSWYAKKSLRGT